MNQSNKVFSATIAVMLLGGLGIAGYFSVKFIVGFLARLDLRVIVWIAAASFVILLAVLIGAGVRRTIARSRAARLLHAEKAALYQQMINVWSALLCHGLSSKDPVVATILEDLRPLDRLVILYGGVDVLKAHTALRRSVRETGIAGADISSQWIRLVLEIRKDLGSGARGLSRQNLEQWLVLEPKRIDGEAKEEARRESRPPMSLAANAQNVTT